MSEEIRESKDGRNKVVRVALLKRRSCEIVDKGSEIPQKPVVFSILPKDEKQTNYVRETPLFLLRPGKMSYRSL